MRQLAVVPTSSIQIISITRPGASAVSSVAALRRWRTLACLGVLLTAGCSSKAVSTAATPAGGGRGRGSAAIAVSTAVAVQKAMPVTFRSVGNVEAYSTVEVHSQVLGQVLSVNFKEGDDVTEGQSLFTLDPRPFQATLDQAIATLAKDTVTARSAEAYCASATSRWSRRAFSRSPTTTRSSRMRRRWMRPSKPTRRKSMRPSCNCNTPRSRRRSPAGQAHCWRIRAR